MSLIPSESHSFPDNYSSVARLRSASSARSAKTKAPPPPPTPARPVERKVVPLPATARETKSTSPPPAQPVDEQFFQALGKMAEQNVAPLPTAPSQSRSVPPRIKIVPRRPRPVAPASPAEADGAVRQNGNGRGRPPQYRPRAPVTVPKSSPVSQPANVRPAIETPPANRSFVEQPNNEFDFADLSTAVERQAPQDKTFVRFIMVELFALAVLIPSAWLVLSGHVTNSTLIMLLNILTMTAAAAMAVVPIILYAIAPGLARPDR